MPTAAAVRIRQIGRYQILEELGRGGMGIVYRAIDPAIGRTVAIKTVFLNNAAGPEANSDWKQRFLSEARSAGSLCHPHVVGVYDLGAERDFAYIVMEFVEGSTLEKILSPDTPLDPATAIPLVRQIAETLDYLHARGIVHRDLKPANILVQPDGNVKLMDFGIAKVLSDPKLTRTGLIIGTPHYMSPEQIQGRPVSARADQFSLAVLAYEMLTGAKPFAGETPTAIVFNVLAREPIAPHTLKPDLGRELERVLRTGLAKAPEDRYPTCTELVSQLEAALQQVLAGQFHGAAVPGRVSQVASAVGLPRWRRWGWVCGAAAVSLVLLLAAFPGKAPQQSRQDGTPVRGWPEPPPRGVQRPIGDKGQHPAKLPSSLGPNTPKTNLTLPGETGRENAGQPRPESLQKLQLFTRPAGATATFDNAVICKTPCTVRLSLGPHQVQVSLAGYVSVQESFELPMQAELSFALHEAIGGLMVTSSPLGASISLNGEARPETTPSVFRLPAGSYQVEISKDGYKRETTTVTVEAGKGQPFHRELTPL